MQDLYSLLGLDPDATTDDVRRAFHEAAMRLHPDVNAKAGETELFLQVKEAYEILSDPDKKAQYDSTWKGSDFDQERISPTVLYSSDALRRLDEPQVVYALLKLAAPLSARHAALPPLNVCLVIDRSTSMKGERMDTVKASAIDLVRQFRPEDVFSIVAFGDRAEVLLPATKKVRRSEIENQIQMLRPSGGTEILHGLSVGLAEVKRNQGITGINHLILLTDGRTYGDEAACLEVADQAFQQGIGITALGIGSEWNDIFLDNLTSRTGGSCMYISRASDIHGFLERKLQRLSQTYAKQVNLHITAGPGVQLRYAFRLAPDSSPLPLVSPIPGGSLLRDIPLSILMEFIAPPIIEGLAQVTLASGKILFNLASDQEYPAQLNLRLTRPVDDAPSAPPPQELMQALSKLTLYQMQERARDDISAGKIDMAVDRLQRIATSLISQGNQELADTVLSEMKQLRHTQAISAEGQKQIKYGTRSLLLPENK